MDDGFAKRIHDAISAERLAPYLAACGGNLEQALRLYAWNCAISSAFLGPISCLEVFLRNALHDQLAGLYKRGDWWGHPGVSLHESALRMLDDAERELVRRGKPVTVGRVIAELPLGFSVSLLGKGNNYDMQFWRRGLYRAFPNYQGRRRPLHRRLDSVRLFRNRITHHEPIHHRHLTADHATILQLIGCISKEAAEFVRSHDQVPRVLASREATLRGDLPPSF